MAHLEHFVKIGVVVIFMIIGYVFGSARERKHFADIQARELRVLHFPVRVEQATYDDLREVFLVTGSVVVATDFFKKTMAGLRSFFGGRVTAYEALMDRARREAILRMKERAIQRGAVEILNMRVTTANLDVNGVEIFAYGTAIKK